MPLEQSYKTYEASKGKQEVQYIKIYCVYLLWAVAPPQDNSQKNDFHLVAGA